MKKFILFSLCSIFHIILFSQNYYFEKISPESGFAFNTFATISEDCNGMVWFGNDEGLYLYNTSSVKKIQLKRYSSNKKELFSSHINKIYNDTNCNIWVCTSEGLYKKNGNDNSFSLVIINNDSIKSEDLETENIIQISDNQFYLVVSGKLYYLDSKNHILNQIINRHNINRISALTKDKNGNFVIGTTDGEIYRSNVSNSNFELLYKKSLLKITSICHTGKSYLIGDRNNGIDVINNSGSLINQYNISKNNEFNLPDNRVRDIILSNSGDIWIATFKGIHIVGKNHIKTITSNQKTGLPYNSIFELHKDKTGGIWVCTWTGGIAYYNNANYRFHHIKKVPTESVETKSIISCFIEDDEENILTGSEQSGINIYSTKSNKFIFKNQKLFNNNIKSIKTFASQNGNDIYIGTLFQGVWHYNKATQKLNQINISSSIDSSIIKTLEINGNNLWIASRGVDVKLIRHNLVSKEIKQYNIPFNKSSPYPNMRIWKLLLDSNKRLWVCTEDGLIYKDYNSEKLNRLTSYDLNHPISSSFIYTVFEDDARNLWIGTRSKGLYKYSPFTEKITRIDNEMFLNKAFYGITQDLNKEIWLSTNNGIYKYNPDNNKAIHYSVIDGIAGKQHLPNAIYTSKNGEVFFGSPNGFSFINPNEIKINKTKPTAYLSKLLINNIPFEEINSIEGNSSFVHKVNNITLSHNQNSLTFGLISNNVIKPQKNNFKYRLKNYNNKWVHTSFNNDVSYTKIPPGNYVFEAYASNNDGFWSEFPLLIHINILEPLFLRWYFIVFYILILVILIYIVQKELQLKINLRKEIISEKYKSDANNELFEEKLRFFTNISHEIRTPLTLIISPLNNLLKKFEYDDKTSKHLQIIKRNSSRLLRLTNQILDFRLLEVNKLQPKFQKTDIIGICNEVSNCFENLVTEKQINFIFKSDYSTMWVSADPDMVEKIIYNLVSNALKFSEDKGQIFLSAEKKELSNEIYNTLIYKGNKFIGKCIEIKVKDFGKGISKDLLPNILERFTTDFNNKYTSSGIGLHLCQEYATLNNGNIMVESETDKGATFILNIPLEKNAEFEKSHIATQFSSKKSKIVKKETPIALNNKSNREVILIAEDNDELRTYLKEFLENYFKVLTAKNGQQAYEIANEVIPNLIISDILMPVLDGIELTNKIKNNKKTCDIPVVILTALSESKYQKKSLTKGVDSYLTKPVDETLLLAQIENILTKINKQSLAQSTQTTSEINNALLIKDIPLVEKVRILVEQNIRNSEFRLENILQELNISKSTLHRKTKSATNQSPTEFVRDIRLVNAVKLMKTQNYNIDEISILVGFNSSSYFIRSFKKKYGLTPKEFMNKHKK